ncbi:MAG: NADPH2:quinone reductase [Verrucomicrobiales bacterium]|jgi:NADPH2:quinone reductase
MRAIQIHETGGPEALQMVDIEPPDVGPGEVLIEVAAAGVNFIDTYQRSGLYPITLPLVLGIECSGTVRAVGSDVTLHEVGDRVAVADGSGSYAELRTATADRCVAIPDDVTLENAAAAMLQGMTAHYLGIDTYPLRASDRCLIHAGAGGTGRLLIQIAKQAGAEVFTTVGTDAKAEHAASAGADHVINYNTADFAEQIRAITGEERPLNVVYDGVGASVFQESMGLLRPRGVMVTFGNASGPVPPVSPLELMSGGSLYLTRPSLGAYISTRDELAARSSDIFRHIAAGSLEITIGAEYSLGDAAQAHRDLESRNTTGKLLLIP